MGSRFSDHQLRTYSLIRASQGTIASDLCLKNVNILDVFTGKWIYGSLSILDGCIVGIGDPRPAIQTLDLKGRWVVPGWIDAHVHWESSLLVPQKFSDLVLSKGTTSAICDPHEIVNVLGKKGFEYFLTELENLSIDAWVMLSSCVPATHLETNGGGALLAEDLKSWMKHPRVLGLAEMMNVPGVLQEDSVVHDKLALYEWGKFHRIDGHAPMLRGPSLQAYALCGISSCHETTSTDEALEKLSCGMKVWIREGSVAKDLSALMSLIQERNFPFFGFCTDDRNPLDIFETGHLDALLREVIQKEVAPELVFRSASWSVASHYGLDRGPNRVGSLAPGYQADLVVLDDVGSLSIFDVYKKGISSLQFSQERSLKKTSSIEDVNTINCGEFQDKDLEGPSGRVRAIGVRPGQIITDVLVCSSNEPQVARLAVLERHGHQKPPACGYVVGFGHEFNGALASSVGHDSHNLICVGKKSRDMAVALRALKSSGGGFCVVSQGVVIAQLPLEFCGLMTALSSEEVVSHLKELQKAVEEIGCSLSEPFLHLAFLALPVIPKLKLTDLGLVDVESFKLIPVAV